MNESSGPSLPKCLVYTISINYPEASLSHALWSHLSLYQGFDYHSITKTLLPKEVPLIFNKYCPPPDAHQYDFVLYVDADILPHWSFNIYELVDTFTRLGGFIGMVRDANGLGWIDDSVNAYSVLFPDVKLDWCSYYNAGMICYDSYGLSFIRATSRIVTKLSSRIISIRSACSRQNIGVGTDQTVFNLFLTYLGLSVTSLPERFNLGHFKRKDILRNLKYKNLGSLLHFNGLGKDQRLQLMQDFSASFYSEILN